MKRAAAAFLLLLAADVLGSAPSRASFEREFENYNRAREFEVLNDLDREIRRRIEDEEKEEAGEKEKKKEKEGAIKIRKPKPREDEPGSPWVVRPAFRVQMLRDSNVFGRRTDAEPEAIIEHEPSVRAIKGLSGWRYLSDYYLTFVENRHFFHNDRFHHDWRQSITRKKSRVGASISNALSFRGFPTEDPNIKLSRIKSNDFTATINLDVTRKFALSGRYKNATTSFGNDAEKASGSRNDLFGGTLRYAWSPKLTAIAAYDYRFSRPPKEQEIADINGQKFDLGLQGRLTPKLAVNFLCGVESQEFADADDKIGLIVSAYLQYRYSPKTDFSISGFRATVPTETESPTDPLNQLIALGVKYAVTPRIKIEAGETVLYVTAADKSTVSDPEHPAILTTKRDESYFLTSRIGTTFEVNRNLILKLEYAFDRVISELQVSDRVSHKARAGAFYRF